MRRLPLALFLLATVACASGGSDPAAQAPTPDASQTPASADSPWPIKTREHVDLWLHGFAMLTEDTTKVPYFRRGYRDQLTTLKNSAQVSSQLDANRTQLAARFAANRNLVSAQFLALYFGNWDELRQVAELFVQAEGNPQRANSRELAAAIATLAGYFPAAADREWLRRFVAALDDESQKFYHDYWVQQQRNRAPVLAALDTLWQRQYRAKLQRFLNGTQQTRGDLLLSLPLDGEGRTISSAGAPGGGGANVVTVSFPDQPAAAVEAVYVFVHEVVGSLAAGAVADNVTPNERRTGAADRLQSAAAVRAGALLVERVAPELADGYARYYLRSAGAGAGGGSPSPAALAAAFPLPDAVRDAIARQLDVVLGGI